MKKLSVLCLALLLGACAAASKPGAMLAPVTEKTIIADNSKLRDAVNVGDVTGGKETSPLWKSNVSSDDFAEALRQSFAAHAMLAEEGGAYTLSTTLEALKQPLMGFDMTVTPTVKYTLTENDGGAVVMEETITKPYTAKMGDAFAGVTRLRLANEGAIKTNIAALIESMISAVDGGAAEAPAEKVMEEAAEAVEAAIPES